MSRHLLFTLLIAMSPLYASTYTWYDDEITLQSYVTAPKQLITQAMRKHHWVVAEDSMDHVVAYLNHRNNEIHLSISFDNSKISFKQLSAISHSCGKITERNPKATCEVDSGDLARWRIHLRKSILALIQDLARTDAMEKYYAVSGKTVVSSEPETISDDPSEQEEISE